MIKISPSLLSADFAQLGSAVTMIEKCGADRIHCDVMDGSFVPNITFGAKTISAIRPYTTLPLDVHLMIEHPERHIESFASAGATTIAVHVENSIHLNRVLTEIRKSGIRACAVLNPATPEIFFSEVMDELDEILVMSVNPGFGGQKFLYPILEKIKRIRAMIIKSGKSIDISVDGGINMETARLSINAGANVLIAGNSIFSAPDMAVAITDLRCGF